MNPDSTGLPKDARAFLVVLLFWAILYLPALFRPALLDDADSVHAEAAREMLLRHDWVTLHTDGIRYLEKAPLMYWTIAASFQLFGVTEWSARLPLALAVLALLYATFAAGRRFFGERAGVLASLILVTSFGPFIFTRILIPDILIGLWLVFGADFFLQSLEHRTPSRGVCWGLAATAALNVLTKGLIGLVFPAAAIGLYLLLTRDLRHLLRMRLVSSALVFLAIAAPWHVLAGLRNPSRGNVRGFFWFYFVNEHLLRYLNKRVPRDYDTVPLLLFWGLMFVWLMPWSAYLPQALRRLRFKAAFLRQELSPGDRARLFFVLWAGFVLFFFSFSTRQEYYVVPAFPALALLLGEWLAGQERSEPGSGSVSTGRISSLVLLVAVAVALVTAATLLLMARQAPPGAGLADLLSKNPEEYALSFGHFLDLNAQAMAVFKVPLLFAGIALLLGGALNWYFRGRGRPARANGVLAVMMAIFLLCAHQGLVLFSPILTSKPLALAVAKLYRPGEVIVINGQYEEGSTLNFYTGREVHILNGRSSDLWYGSLFPDAPRLFEDDASFKKLWEGPGRVYLWTEADTASRAMKEIDPAGIYELARYGGKLILTNRPSDARPWVLPGRLFSAPQPAATNATPAHTSRTPTQRAPVTSSPRKIFAPRAPIA